MKDSIQHPLFSAENSLQSAADILIVQHWDAATSSLLCTPHGGICSCAASWEQQGKRILCGPRSFLAVRKGDSGSTRGAALHPFPITVLARHSSVLPPLLTLHLGPFLPILPWAFPAAQCLAGAPQETRTPAPTRHEVSSRQEKKTTKKTTSNITSPSEPPVISCHLKKNAKSKPIKQEKPPYPQLSAICAWAAHSTEQRCWGSAGGEEPAPSARQAHHYASKHNCSSDPSSSSVAVDELHVHLAALCQPLQEGFSV